MLPTRHSSLEHWAGPVRSFSGAFAAAQVPREAQIAACGKPQSNPFRGAASGDSFGRARCETTSGPRQGQANLDFAQELRRLPRAQAAAVGPAHRLISGMREGPRCRAPSVDSTRRSSSTRRTRARAPTSARAARDGRRNASRLVPPSHSYVSRRRIPCFSLSLSRLHWTIRRVIPRSSPGPARSMPGPCAACPVDERATRRRPVNVGALSCRIPSAKDCTTPPSSTRRAVSDS